LNPACCGGSFDEGSPKGEIIEHEGSKLYITKPSKEKEKFPNSCLVIAPDVFGLKLINNKLVTDKFAETIGCTVVLADYFDGNGMDPYILQVFAMKNSELSWWGWASKYTSMFSFIAFRGLPWFLSNSHARALPKFVKTVKYLRNEKKFSKIGSVGYCYGGGVLSALGSSDEADLVDFYSIQHPGGFKMDQVENFKKNLFWVFF